MVGTQTIFAELIKYSLLTLEINYYLFFLFYSMLAARGRGSNIKCHLFFYNLAGNRSNGSVDRLTRSTIRTPGRGMEKLEKDSGPR